MTARRLAWPALIAGALLAPPAAHGQTQTWLAPRAPGGHSAGVADWGALFAPGAAWGGAAARVSVFDFNAEHTAEWPIEKLAAEVASVRARGMKMSVTTMPLPRSEGTCGAKVEGYDRPDGPSLSAARLKRAGIAPDYVTLDGPMIFGHFYDGETACRSSVKTVAEQAGASIRVFADAFPDAVFGAVESAPAIQLYPDWKQDYAAFLAGVEAASGRRIAYLILDVNWRNPGTGSELPELARFAAEHGLRFGIIYNGDGEDATDAEWTAHARRNLDMAEGRLGLRPDIAEFSSWNDHPSRLLPESDPDSLTGLILAHAMPRAVLTAAREGGRVRGRLTAPGGAGVPGAAVEIARLGADPARALPVRSVEGRAPDAARFALLGWRVNDECLCSGANDLLLGALSYEETAGGAARGRYDLRDEARADGRVGGIAATLRDAGGEPALHLKLAPGQAFQVTGRPFPVTGGASYRLSAPLASLDGGGMFGQATVIFLDADRQGIVRGNLGMDGTAETLATVRTDAEGRFDIADSQAPSACLRIAFAGTDTLRSAARDLPCGLR